MSEEDFKVKSTPLSAQFRDMKVRVSFDLNYSQFLAMEVTAEKSGGPAIRGLIAAIKPQFDKIKKALEIVES